MKPNRFAKIRTLAALLVIGGPAVAKPPKKDKADRSPTARCGWAVRAFRREEPGFFGAQQPGPMGEFHLYHRRYRRAGRRFGATRHRNGVRLRQRGGAISKAGAVLSTPSASST